MRNNTDSQQDLSLDILKSFPLKVQCLCYWAWVVLVFERFLSSFWKALFASLIYLILALFNAPLLLPNWGWPALSVVFGATVCTLFWKNRRHFSLPTLSAVFSRLELDSTLRHAPLHSLTDRPVHIQSTAQEMLWHEHQRRQRDALKNVHATTPQPVLLTKDPLGIRFMVGILLTLGIVTQGQNWSHQIGYAFRTAVPALKNTTAALAIDAWIEPPAYTGRATHYLMTAGEDKIPEKTRLAIPEGSVLQIRIGESFLTPKIHANQTSFKAKTTEGEIGFHVEIPLTSGNLIGISRFGQWDAHWAVKIIEDAPPEIKFTDLPDPKDKQEPLKDDEGNTVQIDQTEGRSPTLKAGYFIQDDYGITELAARLTLDFDESFFPFFRTTPDQIIRLPSAQFDETQQKFTYQSAIETILTDHPWAGFPVKLTLIATDEKGQTSQTEAKSLRLAEKSFTNPTAAQLVQLRQRLLLAPEAAKDRAILELISLAARPWLYQKQSSIFLGLRAAQYRLTYNPTEATFKELPQTLWDFALQIEDGGLSRARDRMLEAQQKLIDALADENTSNAEIEQLMSELEEAMRDYMAQMQQQYEQMRSEGQIPELTPEQLQNMRSYDLSELMQQLRDLSQNGARDQAREMLSQMQEMMRNMNPQFNPEMMEQANRAQELLNELQELTQQQQELLDETHRKQQESRRNNSRQEQENSQSGPSNQGTSEKNLGQRQEELRERLGNAMGDLGNMLEEGIPENLTEAEKDMRRSENHLDSERYGPSKSAQEQALEALQKGLEETVDQMLEQMANQGMMPSFGQGGQRNSRGFGQQEDPFGRVNPEADITIPDEDVKRSRNILRELRKRSGERSRPETELEYIQRLLEKFK